MKYIDYSKRSRNDCGIIIAIFDFLLIQIYDMMDVIVFYICFQIKILLKF